MADWTRLLGRRSQDEPTTAPARTARFDPDKLHPAWVPGVGYELRQGDGPGTPITVDGLRSRIAAVRSVQGDDEADRLQSELDGLVAIQARVEAGHAEPDVP